MDGLSMRSAPGAAARDPTAELHELTKHGTAAHGTAPGRSRLVSFQPLDPTNRPAPFKRYPGRAPVPLPRDLGPAGPPAVEVLSGAQHAAADADEGRFDAMTLARLLYLTAGVTRATTAAGSDRTYFRAAMSAGNLHPVEVYVVTGPDVGDVPPGVHHYAPLEHGLVSLREGDVRGALPTTAPVALVLTGIVWRTAWKYGERGFRHLYWDAGTMLANLLAVADAQRVATRVRMAFVDRDVAALVGVAGPAEVPLVVVDLGRPGSAPPAVAVEPISVDVAPIARAPIELPLVTAAQAGGDLADAAAVERWRATSSSWGRPAAPAALPVPDVDARPPIEEVVLRRGSTRIMRHAVVAGALLTWGMGVASRPVPGDFVAFGATLLEHHLCVHAVDGVDPGAYRWAAGALDSVRAGQWRPVTQRLCLDQPLGGDAAFTAFHAAALGELGARGYRGAHLEAGIASGRLALAAFATGYGATGLTFYDDAVSVFFETADACLLVTAVGVPAYRNTAGGPPGVTANLTGYGELMERVTVQLSRTRPRGGS